MNFEHVFWQCPLIQQFWQEVVETLEDIVALWVPLTLAVCLLGLVKELAPLRAQRTLLSVTLFYTRKAILL